jgi:hypothetical protein
MNRARPHRLAALTALCVLAVTLLAAGCGAAALGASSALTRTSTGQPGEAADSGIGGCTALLGAHRAAAGTYPRIGSQFAHSRWPDLRAAGMAYVDLIVALQTARADGYQTVWFYQRLSLACARHGWNHRSEGTRGQRNGPGGLAVNERARALKSQAKSCGLCGPGFA